MKRFCSLIWIVNQSLAEFGLLYLHFTLYIGQSINHDSALKHCVSDNIHVSKLHNIPAPQVPEYLCDLLQCFIIKYYFLACKDSESSWPVNQTQARLCPIKSVENCVFHAALSQWLLWGGCGPALFNRNLPAVGSLHPGGLGGAWEGCGRGDHAARPSPLCKCYCVICTVRPTAEGKPDI